MKKRFLTALVVSALTSTAAFAGNTGEVRFIGSVTTATCNFNAEVNGVVKDTIDLGTMSVNDNEGSLINFSLAPDNQDCYTKTSGDVSWQTAGFTSTGIANMNGSAEGVAIELVAVNSTSPNTHITANNQTAAFGDGSAEIGKFNFTTRMIKENNATVVAGTVLAVASYAVAYK